MGQPIGPLIQLGKAGSLITTDQGVPAGHFVRDHLVHISDIEVFGHYCVPLGTQGLSAPTIHMAKN
jgi:hypothetical protein